MKNKITICNNCIFLRYQSNIFFRCLKKDWYFKCKNTNEIIFDKNCTFKKEIPKGKNYKNYRCVSIHRDGMKLESFWKVKETKKTIICYVLECNEIWDNIKVGDCFKFRKDNKCKHTLRYIGYGDFTAYINMAGIPYIFKIENKICK